MEASDLKKYALRNFDPPAGKKEKPRLFPENARILLAGGSGSGKTNLLCNLLYRDWLYPYDRLMVFSKSLHQPKYRELMERLSTDGKLDENTTFSNSDDDIPEPDSIVYERTVPKLSKKGRVTMVTEPVHTLLIFDDLLCCAPKTMKRITDLFIRARHFNCTLIFLTQSFFRTPRPLRLQCDQMCVFCPIGKREATQIYQECSADLDLRVFQQLIKTVNDAPYQFLFINKYAKQQWLRYRLNFDRTFKVLVPDSAIKRR